MRLSKTGMKMNRMSGVRAIMQDIILTMRSAKDVHFYNLSAGNPVVLPEVSRLWRKYFRQFSDTDEFDTVLGRYSGSSGDTHFVKSVCDLFNRRYGWGITPENVLVTPGSQQLYFYVINGAAGMCEGKHRKILFPLSPEYTGYANQGVHDGMMASFRPRIEKTGPHEFKYHPDFSKLKIDDDIGAIILSRPCNPAGNVISDEELKKIVSMAKEHNVPVFVDGAYSPPIPGLAFEEMTPAFDENVIHCFSLSKAGMPGARIGVAIGSPRYLAPLQAFHETMCLHTSAIGQAVAAYAIDSGELEKASEEIIRKYYLEKRDLALKVIADSFDDSIPYYVHKAQGTLFMWMWFEGLPVSSQELYERLKKRHTLVVPGEDFFPGLEDDDWKHKKECIRVSLTASDEDLEAGLVQIAEEVKYLYEAQRVHARA